MRQAHRVPHLTPGEERGGAHTRRYEIRPGGQAILDVPAIGHDGGACSEMGLGVGQGARFALLDGAAGSAPSVRVELMGMKYLFLVSSFLE